MSAEESRVMSDIVWTPARGDESPEIRSIAWNNFLLSDDTYSGRWRTNAEVRVTPDTALQSTVFLACCRIISETIATLPLHVYRRLPNGGKEIASDIPLYKVLSFAPNSWQTKYEFFEQLVLTLCMWGNSYSQIRSGKYGSVSELLNLHPSNMDVERLENGRLRYSYTNPETGRLERYTQDQIMHVRWTPEPDGIKGMVPVEIGREAIALARACEIHAAKFWANSARPGIVLQTDGSLSPEAAERLRDNWERLHRGVDRAYKTAILTNGLKAEAIGFSAEQSQFESTRRFQSEEIARIFRLPLHLIQGQQSTGSLETSGREFVTYTLMPWLKRIESAISRSLIYNDDLFFAEFDARALMRGDNNSRAGYYSTMLGLGIFSINDCRKLENLPPLEHGDKHLVAMNLQPLEEAVKPKSQDPMAAMMGGGAPPPAQGGVPSLPGVKNGEAPREGEQGKVSEKKPTVLSEGDLVTWGDGKVGEVKHVMTKGTLDLESGEEVEVEEGNPLALVHDASGKEHAVEVSKLKKAKESRAVADCGRIEGGRFGPKNDCASEDGADESWKDSDREYTFSNHDPDSGPSPVRGGPFIHGISIENPKSVASAMENVGVSTMTGVVGIGGGLTRGASTSVWTPKEGTKLKVDVQIPIDPEDDDVGFMNASVTIDKDPSSGESFVYYDTLYADIETGNANVTGTESKRVSSLLLQVFPESLAAAEKAGVGYATTYAMGDNENEYKGYRLWPKFGFDAELTPAIRKSIPKSVGKPRTVQELISTTEGDRWWNENGTSLHMTLDFKDNSSEGYRKYKSALTRARRMKKRNENRSADCNRVEGGRFGPKNDCASGEGAAKESQKERDSRITKEVKSLPDSINSSDAKSLGLSAYRPFSPVGESKNSDNLPIKTDEELKKALRGVTGPKGSQIPQAELVGKHRGLDAGHPVDLRIDINAFEDFGVYAVTVHEHAGGKGVGKPIGFDSIVRLDGEASFSSNENVATQIAMGKGKTPLATVKGKFSPSRDIPDDIDSWVPVGYDPKKAAYFYDKRTGQEVTGGQDAISVGNSVFVRVAEYGKRKAQKHYRNASFWGVETRDDGCGRQNGGRFGPKNTCAADDGGANVTGGSGGGSSPRPRPVSTPDVVKLLQKIAENPDGFTLDPLSAEQPKDGIMVSEFANDSKRSVKIKASALLDDEGSDAFGEWISENSDLLTGDESKFVGGWKTGDDFYIDVATRFPPEKAEEALERGRKSGQLAVFNLGTFKETWVQYESGDSRKPKEWDSGFARARKDSAVKQVYDESTPDLQDEDWAEELAKHGKKTVRYYNGESEEASAHEQNREIRRSDEGHDHRGLSSVPQLSGEGGGVAGSETWSEMVCGQPGAGSAPIQGSAGTSKEVRGLISETLALSGSLPKIEVRDIGKAIAFYSPEGDTIYVSPEARRLDGNGWVSQPNPVLHELAHRHHLLADAASFVSSRDFTPEERSLIESQVSRYAATNSKEFVAEVLSGYWAGQRYSDEVMALLSDCTGGKVTL